MNMEKYLKEYDELYSGDITKTPYYESRSAKIPPEHTISTEPKISYWESLRQLGPMNTEKVEYLFNRLYDENGKPRNEPGLRSRYPNEELLVASLSSASTKNKFLMLDLTKASPRSFLYVNPKINDANFRQEAVKANKDVYLLLTDEQKKEPGLLDEYRRECIENKLAPNRTVDPKEYYSVEAFKEVYGKWLNGDPISIYKNSLFLQMAEKVNPEMQEQYNQAKHEKLIELSDSLGAIVYSKNLNMLTQTIAEIERHCPELNQTALKEYREAHKDDLIKLAYDCSNERLYNNRWREQLRNDLVKWPEMSEAVRKSLETNLHMMPKPNSNYEIDQTSIYAKIAKEALMNYNGLTEREAIDVLRNSTYEQVESLVHIKEPTIEAARAIGETLGVSKEWVDHFEKSLIDSRGMGTGSSYLSSSFRGTVLEMQSTANFVGDGKERLDKAVINAMRAVSENREFSSIDRDSKTDLNTIRSLDMKDDLSIVRPICDNLGIEIDDKVIALEYNQRDYGDHTQQSEAEYTVEQFRECVMNNGPALEAMIKEGKITVDDIAKVCGMDNKEFTRNQEVEHTEIEDFERSQ